MFNLPGYRENHHRAGPMASAGADRDPRSCGQTGVGEGGAPFAEGTFEAQAIEACSSRAVMIWNSALAQRGVEVDVAHLIQAEQAQSRQSKPRRA